MRNGTNHFLDTIKGIACIGVVFIHVHFLGILGDVIARLFNFAVPIFFMTSGYFAFSYDKGWIEKTMQRRSKRILFLAFWSTMLYTLVINGLKLMKNGCIFVGDIEPVSALYMIARFLLLQDVGFSGGFHLWFLWALFWSYCILRVINHFSLWNKVYRLLPLCLLVIILSDTIRVYYDKSWHIVGNVSMGMTYILLGFYAAKYKERIFKITNKSLVVAVVLGELISLGAFLPIKYDFSQTGVVIASLALFALAMNNSYVKIWNGLEIIGRDYSLNVYIFHIMVLYGVNYIMKVSGLADCIWFLNVKPIVVVLATLSWAAILHWGDKKIINANK